MKKTFFFILGFLFMYGCQKNDLKEPPGKTDNLIKKNFQEWWNNRILNENLMKILLAEPQFIILCDSLNKEIIINRLQQGRQIDSIIKNYHLYLYELINYGKEHNISNILIYKNHYLKSLHPKTKDIIVEDACLLKDTWITTHHTCRFAYEVGYNIYRARGCCEYRFKKSIQESMMYLPESNYNIISLYSYVCNPLWLDYDCEYYVNLMDGLGIPKYERKNRLLELDNNIEEIIMGVAQNPQFWTSCSCTTTGGSGGGSEGGGEIGGGEIGGGFMPSETPLLDSICNPNSPITKEEKKAIENGIKKLISDFPQLKIIFNKLKTIKNKIIIELDPYMEKGTIKYNKDKKILTFLNTEVGITFGAMEDWCHVAQYEIYYTTNRPNNRTIEFEAKMFCDLACVLTNASEACAALEKGFRYNPDILINYVEFKEDVRINGGITSSLEERYYSLGSAWNDSDYQTGTFQKNELPKMLLDIFK